MVWANFLDQLKAWDVQTPILKQWQKVKWTVIKKLDAWVLVDCENGSFTGILLPKEAKELEKKNFDLSIWVELEAELLSLDLVDEEWYFVISISKLLQYDIWQWMLSTYKSDQTIKVIPTEANLWGLLVDIHGIKWFIPLSQLAPVHYPRVEDGDQEKIFERILSLIGKEFTVRIINIDEDGKRMILSEREALREERESIMESLGVGSEYEWVISGVSSYWLFVTIWGWIEWLVHISEITFWHVDNIDRYWQVGKKVNVKVIWFEDGKISLSIKQLKWDPWSYIPEKFKIWDVVDGEVIRFVPYGAFIRVFDDINWLIHLSEITDKAVSNPAEVLRLWQVVKAKLILLDPKNRKLWLSIKAMKTDWKPWADWDAPKKPRITKNYTKPATWTKAPAKKKVEEETQESN